MALKAFALWLAGKTGYRSRIKYSDADYFNLSANDERIAKAVRKRPAPTIDEVLKALAAMPTNGLLQRRDRAVLAFALLSGARDNAIASFSQKHIDPATRSIFHDARDVRTKNAKTFTSTYFPVGAEIEAIVHDWIKELRQLGYGPDTPLFPATRVAPGENKHFAAVGLSQNHWKDAAAIRKIFKQSFERAEMPYFNPHSLRTTLAILGEKICQTPEQWKAYSQNFGHSSPMTTFNSYGQVAEYRQAEILNALTEAQPGTMTVSVPHIRLGDDQVRMIVEQLVKAGAEERV